MFILVLNILFGSFGLGSKPGGIMGSHLIPGPIFYGGLKKFGIFGWVGKFGEGLAFL